MIKETITMQEKKLGLTATNSKVTAVLRSNIKKTGIRLYDGQHLGIAGAIGSYNDEELTKSAKQMLDVKMPYAAEPAADIKRSLDISGCDTTDEEFAEIAHKLLDAADKKYPKFMFNGKMYLSQKEDSLINSRGVELVQKDKTMEFGLLIKHRDSKNLMDSFGSVETRGGLSFEEILEALTYTCETYDNKIDFTDKEEKIPVVIFGQHFEFGMKFITDLRGDVFASGASLFSGKIGEKLFDDKFSLMVHRNPKKGLNFFDGEGVVLPDDKFALIENGVLKSPYTSKRMAKQFNLPITGTAGMVYDSAPDANPMCLAIERSDKTIKELLGGRKAIFAVMAAGGDFTPQGEYASPIQVAYMYDGENLLGRLPQLSMSSNIFDMFGKDFIGASTDGSYKGCAYNYLAAEMNVRKIGDWT